MTNEELLKRIEDGCIPVEECKTSRGSPHSVWVETPTGTLRVAAPPNTGFVQVIDHVVEAVWEAHEVRWIAPE